MKGFEQYEKIVNALSARYVCGGVSVEDLRQEAWLAVIESYPLYSLDMGVSINTYLGRRIRDRLRSYKSTNADLMEVDRKWIAECVEGPEQDITADTKEECVSLREEAGAAHYRKPRRVVRRVRATQSLDRTQSVANGEDSETYHSCVGVVPEQELLMRVADSMRRINGVDSKKICELKRQGYSVRQISNILGKPEGTIKSAWFRAVEAAKVPQ